MSDNSTIQLLPCPFCGGEAKVHVTYETEFVTCTKCGCRTETTVGDYCDEGFMDGSQAIKKWNTRKLMERIVERLEEQADEYTLMKVDAKLSKAHRAGGYITGLEKAIEIVKEKFAK